MGLDRKNLPDRLLALVSPEDRKRAGLPNPIQIETKSMGTVNLYEINRFVGAVPNPESQHIATPALARGNKRGRSGKNRLVARVVIISLRRKAVDGDNLAAGAKWLRDEISKQIGCDDAENAGIEFEYGQIITRGEEGTVVRIEAVKPVQMLRKCPVSDFDTENDSE